MCCGGRGASGEVVSGGYALELGLTQQSGGYIDSCTDFFAQGNASAKAVCMDGWKQSVGSADFVEACLLHVTEKTCSSGDKCREGWTAHLATRVQVCIDYIELASRNPLAHGIAASVVEEEAAHLVRLADVYKVLCRPKAS